MDLINITPTSDAKYMHVKHFETGEYLYATDEAGEQDKSKPVRIKLIGADSPEFRKIHHRRIKKVTSRKGKMSEKDIDATTTEELAECTVGWENVSFGGPLAFSFENAVTLYDKVRWLREQVAEYIHTRENFLPDGPANLSEK